MKRRLSVLVLITVIALAASHAPTAVLAQEEVPPLCEQLNDPSFDDYYAYAGALVAPPDELREGHVLTISAAPPAEVVPDSIFLYIGGTIVGEAAFPGTIIYSVEAGQALTNVEVVYGAYSLQADDFVNVTWEVSCTYSPPASPAAPVAGCDVMMNVPSGSVVGAFIADAPVYWTPGNLASPAVTIKTGKTAWVLGKDTTGQYYKIVWSCDYLWVPVGSMGPNPDAVWHNTPLPTQVVK